MTTALGGGLRKTMDSLPDSSAQSDRKPGGSLHIDDKPSQLAFVLHLNRSAHG